MSDLVARAKASTHLSPTDIQSLLNFISSPKPGDLTDGEWEERVNGILNLLRRQEVSSVQFQVSSRGSAAPGLAEVLLEMAEKNPSKVLRLYAMQHLSLWFGKELDPAKRRAMVGLLEKLATTPGDETAGCAVLMLADMSRQVSSVQFQVSSAEGGAGGGPERQPHQPSATSSATSASPRFASPNHGIDWARVDGILETASRRLVGEAGAGADVRISAIHVCVDRKDAGSLPELRKIAENTALVSTLRKAAIHAIGQLGTAEDAALLESLPQADGNLSMAVQPARKALAKRNAADPPTNRQ